jgi:riboflavin biosynthesis pyrimidine reductase
VTLSPLQLLDERPGLPQLDLPEELARLYGGGLGLAGAAVYANFVETIDGIVAIPDVEGSNALVADGSEADRFVMGVLRAVADVVVVGSGTMLAAPKGTWRADRVYPPAADAYAELRRRLGKREQPEVAIVTAGRSFDPAHPVLETGALVLTVAQAAPSLRAAVPAATEVVVVNDGAQVDAAAAVAVLRGRGHELVLSEGGPALFASFVAAGVVDDLFLTLSPVLGGRSATPRLSLVHGVELLPGVRVAGDLVSVRRHESHLFLHYALGATTSLRA